VKRTSFIDNHGKRIGAMCFEKIFPDRTCALQQVEHWHENNPEGGTTDCVTTTFLINTKG
jgi:hypothetical protein